MFDEHSKSKHRCLATQTSGQQRSVLIYQPSAQVSCYPSSSLALPKLSLEILLWPVSFPSNTWKHHRYRLDVPGNHLLYPSFLFIGNCP